MMQSAERRWSSLYILLSVVMRLKYHIIANIACIFPAIKIKDQIQSSFVRNRSFNAVVRLAKWNLYAERRVRRTNCHKRKDHFHVTATSTRHEVSADPWKTLHGIKILFIVYEEERASYRSVLFILFLVIVRHKLHDLKTS